MSTEKRSLEEAISEVSRELSVRRRCYARWVADGKLSAVEAKDRVERMEKALEELERLSISRATVGTTDTVVERTEKPLDTALHGV